MKQYTNISDQTLIVEGIGPVEPGQTVELAEGFNNANFQEVAAEAPKKKTKGEE